MNSTETIQKLERQIIDLRAALEQIQWLGELGHWDEGGCTECREHEEDGHAPDCIVGKALLSSKCKT